MSIDIRHITENGAQFVVYQGSFRVIIDINKCMQPLRNLEPLLRGENFQYSDDGFEIDQANGETIFRLENSDGDTCFEVCIPFEECKEVLGRWARETAKEPNFFPADDDSGSSGESSEEVVHRKANTKPPDDTPFEKEKIIENARSVVEKAGFNYIMTTDRDEHDSFGEAIFSEMKWWDVIPSYIVCCFDTDDGVHGVHDGVEQLVRLGRECLLNVMDPEMFRMTIKMVLSLTSFNFHRDRILKVSENFERLAKMTDEEMEEIPYIDDELEESLE